MNERLSLQDLIDLLAKKQEMTKKDAEAFLRELVAIITENIEANESVKIKDFGTFKLVKVNARKSVDVNTGEAIEIAAHYKLSFNPDKLLKEAVNRPFAHFESVVLEEGVAFDNIESEGEEDGDTEDDVTIEEDITEYIAIVPPTTVPEKVEEIPVTETEEAVIVEKTETEVTVTAIEEDINISETIAQPVGIINADIAQEKVVEELAGEVAEPQTKHVQDDIITKIVEEAAAHNMGMEDILLAIKENRLKGVAHEDKTIEEELADEDIAPRKTGMRKRYLTLLLSVLLIIAGFVLGGLYFQEIVSFFGKIASDKKDIVAVAETPVPKPQPEVILQDTLASRQDTVKKMTQAPNRLPHNRGGDTQPLSVPPVPHSEGQESKASAFNPLAVETIQPGHTLRNIALKYYGDKSFWVYIYQENKSTIKNINNVPLGTKLIIPAPVKYGINPQDDESVRKAKAMEESLFRQMNIPFSGK